MNNLELRELEQERLRKLADKFDDAKAELVNAGALAIGVSLDLSELRLITGILKGMSR